MTKSSIYIPKKLKVGFVNREDTFSKKLAYVIYYDSLGKLRKEKSWDTWRDKDIEPLEIENEPTEGFMLNKGHTRYNWSHFGTNRTVIRIYDPKGIEFEITPENLVALLMHTDCSKREIQDPLVYAWCGTELLLLPVTSEEYKNAKRYTNLRGCKVFARDLQEGYTYITKKQDLVTYMGRYDYYRPSYYYDNNLTRNSKKQHIFIGEDRKQFFPITSVAGQLAKCTSDECCEDFPFLIDRLLKEREFTKFVKFIEKPVPPKFFNKKSQIAFFKKDNKYYVCYLAYIDYRVSKGYGRHTYQDNRIDIENGKLSYKNIKEIELNKNLPYISFYDVKYNMNLYKPIPSNVQFVNIKFVGENGIEYPIYCFENE